MAAGNQRKHLEFTFSIKALSFPRELAYVRINISSNAWNGYTAVENQEERLFFNETAFPFWCHALLNLGGSYYCIFRNETCYGNGNLYKELLFVYLQPSVIS